MSRISEDYQRIYINLDGVVLSARQDVIDCLNTAINQFCQSEIDCAQYDSLWGRPLENLIQQSLHCDVASARDIVSMYQKVCMDRGFVRATVPEDLHETLHLCKRASAALVGVSSYIPAPEQLLQEKNLRQYFEQISNTMGSRVDHWLGHLGGGDHERTCVVSDNVLDIRSARAYGCFTAAVTWGVSDAWDLGLTTPDVIFYSAAEMKAYFLEGRLPGGW